MPPRLGRTLGYRPTSQGTILEENPMNAKFSLMEATHEVEGRVCRWVVVTCPHGKVLGALEVTEGETFNAPREGTDRHHVIWHLKDLGNGTCEVSPSILAHDFHDGQDCHFGPGIFPLETKKDE